MLPESVLESPFDVISFQYNPSDPSYIAGGTASGQVVLWDLNAKRREAREQRRQAALGTGGEAVVATPRSVAATKEAAAAEKAAGSGADGAAAALVPIAPSFISCVLFRFVLYVAPPHPVVTHHSPTNVPRCSIHAHTHTPIPDRST